MSSARDVFKQHLKKEKQARANSPSPRTVRDFIRICLPDINRAVKQRTSWEIIAKAIHAVAEEFYGVEIRIAPSTAKRAYYDITGKKAKRSRSTSTAARKLSTSASTAIPTQAVQPSVTVVIPEPAPAPEPVARSPAAEVEATTGLADDEPLPSEAEQETVTPTQELHPNRFRNRFKKVKNPRTTTGYENCKSL